MFDNYSNDDLMEAGAILGDGGGGSSNDSGYIVEDEAGVLHHFIPLWAAADHARRRGNSGVKKPKGGKVTKVDRKGGAGGKPGGGGKGDKGRLAGLIGRIRNNTRRLNDLADKVDQLLGNRGPGLSNGPSDLNDPRNGARMWIGASQALPAPGAAGFTAFPNTTVRPSNAVRVVSIVGYCYEDTYAAAAANQLAIPNNSPFYVNNMDFGGTNLLISEVKRLPGEALSVNGNNYGFPIGIQRALGLAASSPIIMGGEWSPRAQAGSNTGEIVFSALVPSVAQVVPV